MSVKDVDHYIPSIDSVPEVSEAIGYSAHEHFQKLFKKKIGKTPSAYRKENSEKV